MFEVTWWNNGIGHKAQLCSTKKEAINIVRKGPIEVVSGVNRKEDFTAQIKEVEYVSNDYLLAKGTKNLGWHAFIHEKVQGSRDGALVAQWLCNSEDEAKCHIKEWLDKESTNFDEPVIALVNFYIKPYRYINELDLKRYFGSLRISGSDIMNTSFDLVSEKFGQLRRDIEEKVRNDFSFSYSNYDMEVSINLIPKKELDNDSLD